MSTSVSINQFCVSGIRLFVIFIFFLSLLVLSWLLPSGWSEGLKTGGRNKTNGRNEDEKNEGEWIIERKKRNGERKRERGRKEETMVTGEMERRELGGGGDERKK